MLAFLVPPQVDFSLESSSAVIAGERFVAGVLPGVRDQVGRLAECFAADRTFVGLFTYKFHHVNKTEMGRGEEKMSSWFR